jgi:hypothetical protein
VFAVMSITSYLSFLKPLRLAEEHGSVTWISVITHIHLIHMSHKGCAERDSCPSPDISIQFLSPSNEIMILCSSLGDFFWVCKHLHVFFKKLFLVNILI